MRRVLGGKQHGVRDGRRLSLGRDQHLVSLTRLNVTRIEDRREQCRQLQDDPGTDPFHTPQFLIAQIPVLSRFRASRLQSRMPRVPVTQRQFQVGDGIGRTDHPARIGQRQTLLGRQVRICFRLQKCVEPRQCLDVQLLVDFRAQRLQLVDQFGSLQLRLQFDEQILGTRDRLPHLFVVRQKLAHVVEDGTAELVGLQMHGIVVSQLMLARGASTIKFAQHLASEVVGQFGPDHGDPRLLIGKVFGNGIQFGDGVVEHLGLRVEPNESEARGGFLRIHLLMQQPLERFRRQRLQRHPHFPVVVQCLQHDMVRLDPTDSLDHFQLRFG